MLVQANREQARAIAGTMRVVATTGKRDGLTEIAHRAITSASRVAFHGSQLSIDDCPTITAQDLAHVLADQAQAMWTIRFLAVTALVDGILDKDKIAVVLAYAETLGVLVRDPGPIRVGGEMRPQLVETRLRVGQAPEEKADDHVTGTASGSPACQTTVTCSCARPLSKSRSKARRNVASLMRALLPRSGR